MATEPKAVIDATKKIAKHLASFEVRQKDFITQLAAASKQLESLDQLTEQAFSRSTAVLKEFATARRQIEESMSFVKSINTEVKAGKDYEMLQRRYLEMNKQAQQLNEEWIEKYEAMTKAKGDKQAKMAFELAGKALEKFAGPLNALVQESEELVPAVGVKMGLRYFESEIPEALAAYKKILVQLLETVAYANADSVIKSLQTLQTKR